MSASEKKIKLDEIDAKLAQLAKLK